MSFYGQIYKITYPGDKHYYIGQTIKRLLSERLRMHIKHTFERDETTDLRNWIRQLPNLDLLCIDPLDETSQDEKTLNDLEDEYLGDLWKTDPFCLNMKPGGDANRVKGEDHPRSSLTQIEADEIKTLWLETDISVKGLAKEYDVGHGTIYRVLRGERYNPLNEPSVLGIPIKPRFNTKEYEAWIRASTIRNFAEKHPNWTGSQIAQHLGMNEKHCRRLLRNQRCYDPDWDPETWTYLN